MKKWMFAAVITMSLAWLAACGNGTNEPTSTEPKQEPNQSEQSQEAVTPDASEAENAADSVHEPAQSAESEVEDSGVTMQYYINEIFDVKPVSEEINEKVVLLTFDDGPKDEQMVGQMLDILDRHDAKAIFFVNGYRVEQNPELLELIYSRGHEVGNHSWDHIVLSKESSEVIDQQIDDVQTLVKDIIGKAPRFFRAPNGSRNDHVTKKVQEEQMIYMNWSNGSLDWDASSQTPEAVIQNVMDQLRPGSNILMHELPWTVEALDPLLTRLEEEGYGFVDPSTIQAMPENETKSK
ncbi:polysaccharide deacetylase family protein [Marinicrinis lubricantis]|uniref:Polysaccharide deacetylase family protein n=1 Tax=Marinicrinis lubricantis TaxID=2086470 RepID=A0ABW1ISJ8_9BACL